MAPFCHFYKVKMKSYKKFFMTSNNLFLIKAFYVLLYPAKQGTTPKINFIFNNYIFSKYKTKIVFFFFFIFEFKRYYIKKKFFDIF